MRGKPMRRQTSALAAAGGVLGLLTSAMTRSREVVIGVRYPLCGPTPRAGVDARVAAELAAESVNGKHDLELPLAPHRYPLPKWSERE
jgi:branched-chain amino acid transport system substrate-binding protein